MSEREKSKKVGPKKRKPAFSSTSSAEDSSDDKSSSKMAEKKTKMGFEQKLQMRIADHLRKNTQKVQEFYMPFRFPGIFSLGISWDLLCPSHFPSFLSFGISQYLFIPFQFHVFFSRLMWTSMKSVDFYTENSQITKDTSTNSSTKSLPLPMRNYAKR